MKLIYRGTTYDYNSSNPGRPFQQIRGNGSAYNLTYRGISYRIDPNTKSAEVPIVPATYKLSYRGITYLVNRNTQGKISAVAQLENTPVEMPSPNLLNHQI